MSENTEKTATRKAKWFKKNFTTPPSGSAGGISSRVGVPGPRRESYNDVSRAATAFLVGRGMQVGFTRMQYSQNAPQFKNTEETEP